MSDRLSPSAPSPCEPPLVSEFAGDPNMVDLIRFFVEELLDTLDSISPSSIGHDRESLRRFAHQVKGAAGGYGYPAITRCAGDLETMVVEGASEADVMDAFATLSAMCRRAVPPGQRIKRI